MPKQKQRKHAKAEAEARKHANAAEAPSNSACQPGPTGDVITSATAAERMDVDRGDAGVDSLTDAQPIVPDFVTREQVLDYVCVFCKKVAIADPHQALLCACRMCATCVLQFIDDCLRQNVDPFCPGATDDCHVEALSMTDKQKNRVVRDRAAINDLELLDVRCTNRAAGCLWTESGRNCKSTSTSVATSLKCRARSVRS